MRRRKTIGRLLLLLSSVVFAACSVTRYVPDDRLLLDHVRVVADDGYRDINTSMLRNYVRQRPNTRWFMLYRLPLAAYSLSGRDTARWVNRTLRGMGEPPVLFDSLQAVLSQSDLSQAMQGLGYLHAATDLEVRPRGHRKVDVTYRLHPGEPYFLRSIRYEVADSLIGRLLKKTGDSTQRLVREGQPFQVALLDAERTRLSRVLGNHGYYRFHKEFVTCQADTAPGSRLIDVVFRVGLYRHGDYPDTLHTVYRIGHIDYQDGDAKGDGQINLRKGVLRECTHLEPDSLYSASELQNTYNHFGRLQAVKYTGINFRERPDTTGLLDCTIQLQTNKPSTISLQPEGTNTAGDLGAAATLTYQNRNLFRGSELLSIELRGAYEAIRGLEGYSNQDFLEYSVQTRLAFPRFVLPVLGREVRRGVNVMSEVSLLYDLQDRPEFHRRVVSAGWSYKWSRQGRYDRWRVDVLDLNYVFMPWISDTFRREYLDQENTLGAILRFNYEDLFIAKSGVSYSYSHRDWALKWSLESGGNILSLLSKLTKADKDERGQYRLFNIAYAQYAKGDLEVTRSLSLSAHNQLVFHLGLGIAYPYGNTEVLPFEKRYFSGGANSVRGWSVRTLGPGRYKERDGRINFINQTGDMKLDLNVEFRSPLFWKLGAALFVDAGNIWTIREHEWQPGGQFRPNTFMEDLAVGYGLGFRFNFDYFILRFDLGMKAVNPAFRDEDEAHFPLLHPVLSRDLAFHFAVGLPF